MWFPGSIIIISIITWWIEHVISLYTDGFRNYSGRVSGGTILISDIIHVLLPQWLRVCIWNSRILVRVLGDSSAGGWEPPPDASNHKLVNFDHGYRRRVLVRIDRRAALAGEISRIIDSTGSIRWGTRRYDYNASPLLLGTCMCSWAMTHTIRVVLGTTLINGGRRWPFSS